MPEEAVETERVYTLLSELGLKITHTPPGYKWYNQAWVGPFETRQAAVRAAFADAIQTMKERDTMRREIMGLQAAQAVAHNTINRLAELIGSNVSKEEAQKSDDQEEQAPK